MKLIHEGFTLPDFSWLIRSGGPRIEAVGDYFYILYDFPDKHDESKTYNSGLRFKNVKAHSSSAELHCADWKSDALDKLMRIDQSPWKKKLLENLTSNPCDSEIMNHYLIYFDGTGSIEVIAESWEELPQRPGSLTDRI